MERGIGSCMTGTVFRGSTVAMVNDEAVKTLIVEVEQGYLQYTGLKPEFFVAEIVQIG